MEAIKIDLANHSSFLNAKSTALQKLFPIFQSQINYSEMKAKVEAQKKERNKESTL